LIHEKKFSNLNAVVQAMELALKGKRALLIVSKDVESDALATRIPNRICTGVRVCAIKTPGFGENREANLHDLAVLTGGQMITEERGIMLETVEADIFGTAKKVTVSKDDTIILDENGRESGCALML
jgi:chaperonin GroEL